MSRELLDTRRCTTCQAVIDVLVRDDYVTDNGENGQAIHWLGRRKHGADECTRQVRLNEEEWPVLFTMEA